MKKEKLSQDTVDFHYVKSGDFRVVHADGVWGGATFRGYITMSFFSERHPIPRKISREVNSGGTLGQEISRDSKEGVVRDVQVEVMMDLAMAKSMIPWLNEKIQILEEIQRAQAQAQEKGD